MLAEILSDEKTSLEVAAYKQIPKLEARDVVDRLVLECQGFPPETFVWQAAMLRRKCRWLLLDVIMAMPPLRRLINT